MSTLAKLFQTAAISACLFMSSSCEDSSMSPGDINDPDAPKGTLKMSMTDAPIDDASVSGAFVTVTEVRIDGKKFEGFGSAKTINVLSLQNGKTFSLGEMQAAAGTYSTIELVLDYDKDASGQTPGCYVQKTDGTKDKLALSGSNETVIKLSSASDKFSVKENTATELIFDFDLRKSVTKTNNDYSFVTYSELQSAIRTEKMSETGTISGTVTNKSSVSGDLIVYAYKKGTFNSSTETKAQGSSNVQFKNAVTSAKVDNNGNYMLAFLEKGDYEIHCSKPETNSGGQLNLGILLDIESTLDLKSVKVNSGTQTKVNLSVKTSLLGL